MVRYVLKFKLKDTINIKSIILILKTSNIQFYASKELIKLYCNRK